jgi:hypothetical protein
LNYYWEWERHALQNDLDWNEHLEMVSWNSRWLLDDATMVPDVAVAE